MINKNYITVSNDSQFKDMLDYITSHDELAYDTETTGLNVRKDKIIGFSVTGKVGTGYYYPLYKWDLETEQLVDANKHPHKNAIILLEEIVKKNLIMHNASFDCRITKNNFEIDLVESLVADTVLMKHTVDEEHPFGLKEIAIMIQDEIGLDVEKAANEEQLELIENIKKNGGSTTKTNYELYKADVDVIGKYANADTDLTFRLFEYYYNRLEEEELLEFFFDDEVMPLYKEVTITMEDKGILLDLDLIEATRTNIEKDMGALNTEIVTALKDIPQFKEWYVSFLNKKYPPTKGGAFGQKVVEKAGFTDLPKTKSGRYSLTEKNIKTYCRPCTASGFLLGNSELNDSLKYEIQNSLHLEKEGFEINISSKKQVGEVVFDYLKIPPLSHTDKGNPQFNDTFVEYLAEEGFEWAFLLSCYNKLNKIKGAYIDRFLEQHEEGYFYPSFFQHRTISGRYGSDLQQLPRPKEEGELPEIVLKYNNIIRKFFISGHGRKFIDADYESLEPHVFSHVSNDEGLRDIFRKGHDFYSTIAIATEGLKGVSANKKADNYLGKVNKPLRQKAKAYCFTKDTLVQTISGFKTIDSIKIGDVVKSKNGYNKVTNLFKRTANALVVHTNRGSFECTPDHKIFVGGNWVEAKDLKEGSLLDFDIDQDIFGEEQKLPIFSNFRFKNGGNRPIGHLMYNDDWAYFVGAILGDGVISISQENPKNGHGLKGYVGICGLEQDNVVAWVDSFFGSLGYKPRLVERKGRGFVTKIVNNSELAKLVYDTLKLGDMKAETKKKNLKIPDYVWSSTISNKLAFIAGLLDTDRYLKAQKGYSDVCFCSKDFRLSTGLCTLLQSLGVNCSYRLDYNKTYKRNYYLVTITRLGVKKLNSLGLHKYLQCGRKKEAIECAKDYKATYKTRLHPAKVKKVEFINEKKEVYDITVNDEHCFRVSGILVHNCLGIPYGLKSYALSKTLAISIEEAQILINNYLNAYPELKKWMMYSENHAKYHGWVKVESGRVRHLPKVKELHSKHKDKLLDIKYRKKLEKKLGKHEVKMLYMDYKNGLNNAKNVCIQGLSASIVSRAMIAINREFAEKNIDGWVCASVHDQIIANVPEKCADECREIVQRIMETVYKISIDLKAPAEIGDNFCDAH